jgi:hypothetical protein
MKKRALRITVIIVTFIFAFSINCIGGLIDEEIHTGNAEQKPEANTSNSSEPNVVSVTASDTQLSSVAQSNGEADVSLTPIEEATSIASGLMASGKTDKSVVIATLVSYGYEQTEAEIAFAKASSNNVLDTAAAETDVIDTSVGTDTEPDQTQTDTTTDVQEQAGPETSPKDRVSQGIKPKTKFRNRFVSGEHKSNFWGSNKKKVTEDEKATVTAMLDEGYSLEQISQGFADNGYNVKDTAAVLKESGVSASDAYTVLSSAEVKKAEAEFNNKPKTKFSKRFSGLGKNKETLDDKKQDALKSVVNDMEAGGYDVQGTLDTIVQDLKDNGMSASEVKDFINPKVGDGKPKSKFKGSSSLSKRLNTAVNAINSLRRPTKMTSYGEGEIDLASAMLKAGFSESEVTESFQNGNQKYTKADTQLIVSAGQYNIDHPIGNNNVNTNAVNTNNNNVKTQEDILQRQTQATPI